MVATEVKPEEVKFPPATEQEIAWLVKVINGRRLRYVKKVV